MVEHVLSNVEFRRANNAELLAFSVGGSRGGSDTGGIRGGNGGGDISSLGGRIGAFGACLAYICSKVNFLNFLYHMYIQ